MGEIKYSLVVPLFNEEKVIDESYNKVTNVMESIEELYEIIFVNDGSVDLTEQIAKDICKKDKRIKLINFSRNYGHQAAITAGMNNSKGKAIIVIDADLQDPPEIIVKMVEKWKQGYDVVYGKRIQREGETFFKKITASIFYRILRYMTDFDIPVDTGDFRLIDKRVNEALKTIGERNRYIRGLISWLGFKQTYVEYVRKERFAGETKYPLKKMMKFALDAITSFSFKPLRLASYMGIALSLVSFIYLTVVIYTKLFTDKAFTGWASTLAVSLLFNGIILIILGIMGEYIGRLYDEVKARPLYIIKDKNNFDEKINND
ncbi:MAG: glycosyltransferase family 2 protein [Clostridiales bacterium]